MLYTKSILKWNNILPHNNNSKKEFNPNLHILLADDNTSYQRAFSKILSRLGFKVITANDGHDTLSLYQASPDLWHLILIDYHMPIMDGCMTTLAIRQFERKENLPSARIIGICHDCNASLKKKAIQCGMNAVFSKPQDLEKTIEIIKPYSPNTETLSTTLEKNKPHLTSKKSESPN